MHPLQSAIRRSLALRAALAAVVLMALASPWPALAGDAGACRSDALSLCKGVQPGAGRMVACLQQHEQDLSAACKVQLPALAACQKQVQALCGDPAPRQLRQCAEQHRAELGRECRAALPAR